MDKEEYYKWIESNDFYPEHSHQWIVRTYTGGRCELFYRNFGPFETQAKAKRWFDNYKKQYTKPGFISRVSIEAICFVMGEIEQLIRDELLEEIRNSNNEHLTQIIIHPETYKIFTEATDISFFGKLKYGWKLFFLSVSDWKDARVSEDYVEEFFKYLGTCEDL